MFKTFKTKTIVLSAVSFLLGIGASLLILRGADSTSMGA